MAKKKNPKKKKTSKKKKNTGAKKKTAAKKKNTAAKKKVTAKKKNTAAKKNAAAKKKNTAAKKQTTTKNQKASIDKKQAPKQQAKKVKPKNEKIDKKIKKTSPTTKETKKEFEKGPRKARHKEAIAKESMRPQKKHKSTMKKLSSSNATSSDYEMVKKLIIITVSIVAVLFLTYFLTNFIREVKKEQAEAENKVIQNEEILASRIFDKADKEYYVVLYDMTNIDNELLSAIISDYRQKELLPIFEVDLDSMLNKSIIAETEVSYDKEDFKIKETTLLHIKDNEITAHYNNDAEVIKFLKDKVITLITK